jgi:hypothetical protein
MIEHGQVRPFPFGQELEPPFAKRRALPGALVGGGAIAAVERGPHQNEVKFFQRGVEAPHHHEERRGEVGPATDGRLFVETLIVPIYFRAILSMEPIESLPLDAMIERQIAAYR